jgi:FPC/CPF motif-containing protein YcgG
MRLHLKQQPPDVHGMITEHKASHGHKSKEDTVTCLIREAMKRFDETDKIEDLTKLLDRYITQNDKLKAALVAVKVFHKAENVTPKDFDELMYKIQEALKG